MSLRRDSKALRREIPEPLPLFVFEDQIQVHPAHSFFKPLPHIPHLEAQEEDVKDCIYSGADVFNVRETVGLSSKLTRCLEEREKKEQSCFTLVYKRLRSRTELSYEKSYASEKYLDFSSEFESGNLERVEAIHPRHYQDLNRTSSSSSSFDGGINHASPLLPRVDEEYDLYLLNDINTRGNTQWYYFKASNISCKRFPLKVRFNIRNLRKRKSLYLVGKKPVVYRCGQSDGWRHGGDDICYYRNGTFYTLSFTFSFDTVEEIYFASCFPYTYTQLQKYLFSLEKDERVAKILRRRSLCSSLGNNRVELLTISAAIQAQAFESREKKPAVVISARVHPGESNSSYAMEGIIRFLTSDRPEAKLLREAYTFKLLPMLNPDGVIDGATLFFISL